MFNEYLKYVMITGDDQTGLNQLLLNYGTTWEKNQDLSYKGRCEQLNLDIYVLPDSMMTRKESELREEKVIFQPNGSLDVKLEQIRKIG